MPDEFDRGFGAREWSCSRPSIASLVFMAVMCLGELHLDRSQNSPICVIEFPVVFKLCEVDSFDWLDVFRRSMSSIVSFASVSAMCFNEVRVLPFHCLVGICVGHVFQ